MQRSVTPSSLTRERRLRRDRRRSPPVLGVPAAAEPPSRIACSSATPFSRRPVGVTRSCPPNIAATEAGGCEARTTRPLADANAGVFEPTWVTSRTGWDVSSSATKSDSRPSRIASAIVSSCRVRNSAATVLNAVTIGSSAELTSQDGAPECRARSGRRRRGPPSRARRERRRSGAACSSRPRARVRSRTAPRGLRAASRSSTRERRLDTGDVAPGGRHAARQPLPARASRCHALSVHRSVNASSKCGTRLDEPRHAKCDRLAYQLWNTSPRAERGELSTTERSPGIHDRTVRLASA